MRRLPDCDPGQRCFRTDDGLFIEVPDETLVFISAQQLTAPVVLLFGLLAFALVFLILRGLLK